MERLYSHSKTPTFSSTNKPPPPQSTSFKNNGGGFFSTTSYDDVFGGPPKFTSLAPQPEDYSEIFGGFRLSSSSSSSHTSSPIPVLDLPAVPDDIAAAFFDYSEVFSAFNNGYDFALPFHQLFPPCDDDHDDHNGNGNGNGGASFDETW